uniref:Leucine rich repeat containing 49 n=1 Tax=Rousettus aegyptiacus TaxID=9407 RepID=A0A7J8INF9_ROUAE|nr:leucine rich repeat containing 49 [Rousettus aegyptiacus]
MWIICPASSVCFSASTIYLILRVFAALQTQLLSQTSLLMAIQ